MLKVQFKGMFESMETEGIRSVIMKDVFDRPGKLDKFVGDFEGFCFLFPEVVAGKRKGILRPEEVLEILRDEEKNFGFVFQYVYTDPAGRPAGTLKIWWKKEKEIKNVKLYNGKWCY